MASVHYSSEASVAGHPIHATLAQFPIVCFTLTLFTDIAYWRTSYLMWQYFSEWLLLAGVVFGGLAVLAGIVDLLFRRRRQSRRRAWPHTVGSVLVLILAFVNSLVHAGDGWTAVVPYGLILSAVTVAVMVVSDWLGRSMTARQVE